MKKQILILMMALLLIGIVSAYDGHKFNTDLTFSINSNNASYCNVTTLDSPNNFYIMNIPMTKDGQDFYITLNKNNFTKLGDYCFNLKCTDGTSNEVGSKCFEVTPSGNNGTDNLVFFIFLIVMVYAISFIGFFGKNEWITILGGMFMLFLGIYLTLNGIIIYRDDLTRYFSIATIALGAFFAIYTTVEMIENSM